MPMPYEYSGYFRNLVHAPDPKIRESLPCVEFGPADLVRWNLLDDDRDKEWQRIPVFREGTENGVMLRGSFENLALLDTLRANDPSYWVPLSSRDTNDERFPIDLTKYPVAEITYRCISPNAKPGWIWHYPGGQHFDGLKVSNEWRTIARRIQHFGFPQSIDHITFRLYSTTRTPEAVEIHSIRFRALSPGEEEASGKHEAKLLEAGGPASYPLLDSFLPIGVFMRAASAKRQADMMDISFRDYWRLALEDVARHHHNSVALEEMEALSPQEWREILGLAESFRIRILAMFNRPTAELSSGGVGFCAEHIAPYAQSSSVLGWCLQDEPPESSFHAHMAVRPKIEAFDPNHPLCVFLRDPNAFPLYAPYFAACGLSYFKSDAPWELGPMVRAHHALRGGQQVWVGAPAYVYATETPTWHTCPEMRLMLNLAFANGAGGWFSYAYHNEPFWLGSPFQRSLTGPYLTFSDLWSELGYRAERFQAMSPLFMNARPVDEPPVHLHITAEPHPRTKRPEPIAPVRVYWLQGDAYYVLYLVSNDVGEVTSVRFRVPEPLPKGWHMYDATDFVRSRQWQAMPLERHIEMFPGQGQVILLADPDACLHWRDQIAERLLEDDRRQIAVDLNLARRYELGIADVQRHSLQVGMGEPHRDILRMREARELLTNILYDAPVVVEPRSRIVQACAAIAGCDAALAKLFRLEQKDEASRYGEALSTLARELTAVRLKLRRGYGREISVECGSLAERCVRLLKEIQAVS